MHIRLSGQKEAAHPRPNLGSPARVILNTLLIFLASQIAAVFAVGLAYGLVTGGRHPDIGSSVIAQFFYILIAESLAALLAIKLTLSRSLKLGVIGLGRRPVFDDAVKAGIGFAVFWGLLIIAGILISAFSPDLNNQKQNLGFDNLRNNTETALAFISLVILPPLGEEVLMRGYLYSGLRRWWRFWPSLMVTSLVFGLAHLEFGSGGPLVWAAAIDTFLLSIILVYLRERTGALYAGILLHMLNNFIAFFVVIK